MHFSVPAPPSDVNGCQEAPKSIEVETTVRPSVGVQLAVQTGIAWQLTSSMPFEDGAGGIVCDCDHVAIVRALQGNDLLRAVRLSLANGVFSSTQCETLAIGVAPPARLGITVWRANG